MKTNAYLGLIGLQLGMGALQQNGLDKKQAARDAEQRALTEQAAKTAQNAHYAQWRQTPDGQHYETWRTQALDVTATARNRNAAWRAALEAAHTQALEQARGSADTSPATIEKQRSKIAGIAAAALLVLSLIVTAAGGNVGANIGAGLFLLAAVALTVALVYRSRANRAARTAETAAQQQAHATTGARSWHPSMSVDRIDEVASQIEHVVATAAQQFPAPHTLPPLAPMLETRPPSGDPDAAQRLLHIFHGEDAEKLKALNA